MCPVIYQPGYVVFRHLRQLLLEDTFETSENDEALPFIVVIYDSKLYFSSTLFNDGRLNLLLDGFTAQRVCIPSQETV